MTSPYPFSAIVGQEPLKRGLLLLAIDASIGGLLILGDRGTGKSTAVRALAKLLPDMTVVKGCRYGCAPEPAAARCAECRKAERSKTAKAPVPMVDLPLGVSEDRLVGALDLERAKTVLKSNTVIDLRNIYSPPEMVKKGFDYTSVGR